MTGGMSGIRLSVKLKVWNGVHVLLLRSKMQMLLVVTYNIHAVNRTAAQTQ